MAGLFRYMHGTFTMLLRDMIVSELKTDIKVDIYRMS